MNGRISFVPGQFILSETPLINTNPFAVLRLFIWIIAIGLILEPIPHYGNYKVNDQQQWIYKNWRWFRDSGPRWKCIQPRRSHRSFFMPLRPFSKQAFLWRIPQRAFRARSKSICTSSKERNLSFCIFLFASQALSLGGFRHLWNGQFLITHYSSLITHYSFLWTTPET